jgi:hypothetical protein
VKQTVNNARNSVARKRVNYAKISQPIQKDRTVLKAVVKYVDPMMIRIHPEALQAYSCWRDIPRQPPITAAADSIRCLVLNVRSDLQLISGFAALDAATSCCRELLAVVTRSPLDSSMIRSMAWAELAQIPNWQVDFDAGAALWLQIVNSKMPSDIRHRWFGKPAVSQCAGARIFGVTRERVAPSRLGGKP